MKTYEYIFAAIIMVAILLAAVFLTGISPPLYRSTSEVEQLKMAAQKIMAQIILSPGEPEDWGENITVRASDLSSLGLAVSTVFTREAFVLDPDKVQRLSQSLPGDISIQPNTVRSLLNLGFDYDIKMEFIPALKIEIRQIDLSGVEVSVVSEQGMPAVNANVTVGAVFTGGGVLLKRAYGFTDENGKCTLSLNFFSPALLIAAVDYYGVQGVTVKAVGAVTNAYFIGRFLLSSSYISSDEAYQIFLTKLPNGSISIGSVHYELTYSNKKIDNYYVYEMNGIEPYTVAVVTASDSGFIAAWKKIPESFGSSAKEMPLAYMLERSVKIGLSSYTVRLWVWRVSW
ncbi:MAG: hypothetical protein QXJ13_06515 [Candidatus Bathyarchaeia archaeon]